MSYSEQQEYYESLLKKYKTERELLESYKDMCKFDINDLDKEPSESYLKNEIVDNSSKQLISADLNLFPHEQVTGNSIIIDKSIPINLIKEENDLMEMDQSTNLNFLNQI